MQFKNLLSVLIFATLAIFSNHNPLFGQVTTATVSGLATDNKGMPLAGTSIIAVHTPSGTTYGTTTRADGRYTIPNMRVGGPYTVSTSFVGFKTEKVEDLFLSVGQRLPLNFKLLDAATTLQDVVIKADNNAIMNNQRTGAATNISNEQLIKIPTISRSASDIYKLTPMADGNSFGGRNSQYNNFSLDGTIFNNPFGLDAATPGGQTDAQPVSLDAIDQIQVSIAPYDVTQAGFTGASINAVTKSGTNQVKGTVFGFFRNQNLVNDRVDGTDAPVPALTQYQTGFSVGAPIIKNKAFVFINAELERREDLGSAFLAARPGLTGANVSRVQASDLDAVRAALKNRFNYETGDYENYKHKTHNQKALIKFDFNLSQNHKLSVNFNTLDAFKEKPANPLALGRRGPDATTLQFFNSGYRINNKIYSTIGELKSTFGARFANKFQIGYTAFRDSRSPFSSPFPSIAIQKDGINYIIAGHEPFSINNSLKQDVFQINNNFNIYLKRHTITIGGALEKFSFDNSFNLGTYAGAFGPAYGSVQGFLDSVNTGRIDGQVSAAKAVFEANNTNSKWALAETNVGQLSFYAQDEFVATPNLNITFGLRADIPLYFDTKTKIEESISRSPAYFAPDIKFYDENGAEKRLDSKQLPAQKPLLSPRIGFNWDVKGDQSTQLRGGTGLFTGRFPFVWIGNQVANPNFFFYCVTDPNFKFPQVWRSNLGYDQKFGKGWTLSTDFIYTRDINAMMVRDYGLNVPKGTLAGIGDNRPYYNNADKAQQFGGPTSAYVFTNNNLGYTFNASVQLQKNWAKGLFTSLGYNYGVAMDAASITAEISSDAFARNPAYGNVNQAVLANSIFGNRHRIVGNAYKKFSYAKDKMATTITTFFQYVEGGRYSYIYSGDINNDGSNLNDLLYIPTDAQIDQMKFSGDAAAQTAQRTAFKAYIGQDKYLSANRGNVAGKFANLSPWYNNWDVRVLQDFYVKRNTFQLSFDVLNFGNLLNSKWGIRQIPTNSQPVGVAVDANRVPTYSFDTALKNTFTADPSFVSRYQMQVGLRWIF